MMKKTAALILTAMLLAGCSTASTSTKASSSSETAAASTAESVDAVTSPSVTRSELSGDDLSAAYDELVSLSNDLATGKEASAADYKAPDSVVAQVMSSASANGYPSLSTIHAWKVDKDAKTITVVMTDGTTIEGLINSGDKGTILIHGKDNWYILHVTNSATKTLAYSDEAYADGKGDFNMDYSGAEEKKTEYTVTFSIDEIESTAVYMFN